MGILSDVGRAATIFGGLAKIGKAAMIAGTATSGEASIGTRASNLLRNALRFGQSAYDINGKVITIAHKLNQTTLKTGTLDDLVDGVSRNVIPYKQAKRVKIVKTAEEANLDYPSGWHPPHKSGHAVTETVRSGSDLKIEQYVRVHGDDNVARPWIMKKSDYDALKVEAQQANRNFGELLRERLALPATPTKVSRFTPPDETILKIRQSTVNPLTASSAPNQIQFELPSQPLNNDWFQLIESL